MTTISERADREYRIWAMTQDAEWFAQRARILTPNERRDLEAVANRLLDVAQRVEAA